MIRTIDQLKGDFIVLDLGSAHTEGLLKTVPGLTEAITLIEVDPLMSDSARPTGPNRICLKKAVAGKAGKRTFKQRKFPDCSSFLEPKRELIEAYGLEDYFVLVNTLELECETISELLRQHDVKRLDFFKTDLEGLDFEVLSSAPQLVEQALCVQCELRFQPFYEGEPCFHEVAGYLSGLGLDLISLRPAIWKYATPNRGLERDGRTVWADAIFFLNPKSVQERFGNGAWKSFSKQIILARLLGLINFAEHLYLQIALQLPQDVRTELGEFVKPPLHLSRSLAGAINKLPLGWAALELGRRFSRRTHQTASLYREAHMGEI